MGGPQACAGGCVCVWGVGLVLSVTECGCTLGAVCLDECVSVCRGCGSSSLLLCLWVRAYSTPENTHGGQAGLCVCVLSSSRSFGRVCVIQPLGRVPGVEWAREHVLLIRLSSQMRKTPDRVEREILSLGRKLPGLCQPRADPGQPGWNAASPCLPPLKF